MSSIRSILEEVFNQGTLDMYDPNYVGNKRAIDQALLEISQIIGNITPDIKNHICRFNDGNCVCECYKSGQDEFKSNIKEILN